jgi:Domain of unknown function (DUF4276)
VTAKIYIEGGGEGQLLDTLFRQGWTAFFRSTGLEGRMPRVVRGQGRDPTIDLFATAGTNPRPGELPLLLVDSEGPFEARTAWEHLGQRPLGAGDDQAFLMVQVMEAWFLADRDLLRRYFGSSLRDNALPAWPSIEDVPKEDVLNTLRRATAACPVPYSKGKVSFELLTELSPQRVEAACPNARRLLDRLRNLEGS